VTSPPFTREDNMETSVYDICRTCGGDGIFEYSSGGEAGQCACPGCDGTGRLLHANFELDVPTTAQFQAKFDQIEAALTAIWNKVKNL